MMSAEPRELPELPPYFAAIPLAGGNHAVYTSSQMHKMYRRGYAAALAQSRAQDSGGVADDIQVRRFMPRLGRWSDWERCLPEFYEQNKDKPAQIEWRFLYTAAERPAKAEAFTAPDSTHDIATSGDEDSGGFPDRDGIGSDGGRSPDAHDAASHVQGDQRLAANGSVSAGATPQLSDPAGAVCADCVDAGNDGMPPVCPRHFAEVCDELTNPPPAQRPEGDAVRVRRGYPRGLTLSQGPDDVPVLGLHGSALCTFPAGSWSDVVDALAAFGTTPPNAEPQAGVVDDSLRMIAKRNLRRMIELGSDDKRTMLLCLEELS